MRAQKRFKIVNLDRVRITAGEQRSPRRIAQRELAVRAVELQTLLGESVDVRRLDMGLAAATELRPEVVDGDEQDIRPRLTGFGSERGRRDAAEQGDTEPANRSVHFHGTSRDCGRCAISFVDFFVSSSKLTCLFGSSSRKMSI